MSHPDDPQDLPQASDTDSRETLDHARVPEPSLAELVLRFLETKAAQGASPMTLKSRRDILRRLVHFLAQRGISTAPALTPEAIIEFLQALAEPIGRPRLSHTTLAHYAQGIRVFLAYLTEHGSLLFDLISHLPSLPNTNNVLPIVPSQAQVQAILDACPVDRLLGLRTRALLELLYGSACRIGEAMSLTLSDLDLETGRVMIRSGKGNKDRVVPLSDGGKLWLGRYLTECRPWLVRKTAPTNAVFLGSTTGRPLSITVGRLLLQECARKAGIALPVVPHSLRHAAATHLLSSGCDIHYIQLLLGHSDPNTTQRYTKVAIDDLTRAHARFHPAAQAEPEEPGSEETQAEPDELEDEEWNLETEEPEL